ncbi:MAG: hypothetical protein F6K54_05605 [Okeania sp. SIO3B5]|uniref:hypothetical protein n=1 Tax=Okeania sp. SIO3B5 TaxID=2607811 RepID=UPI001400066C|nr:hypothetical protein [Okeania sp. SIO3B5]NEO52595.1 hypothetical protein [Okeania sp. SIO3B5]
MPVTTEKGATIVYINGYQVNGEQRFQKKELRKILGIKAKKTISDDLKAIGEETYPWTWETVRKLIGLKLFLAIGRGDPKYSRQTYLELIKLGEKQLKAVLQHHQIDIEQEFQKVKNDYENNQQRNTFSYRANRRRIDTASTQPREEKYD